MIYSHYIFGEFITGSKPLGIKELEDIFRQADKNLAKIQDIPLEKILQILDLMAEKWLDPEYHYRKLAMSKMPKIAGYSERMTAAALDALFENMRRKNLLRMVRGHIGRTTFLDRFEYNPAFDGYIKAQPLGILLHVSPGNVFVGGIDSLMMGLVSKNVNLLKISGRDPLFPLMAAKSLQEIDEGDYIASTFAMLSYSGGDTATEDFLKQKCDGIVVYGGEEAVMNYRRGISLGTRLIEYGPKYSFAIITQEGFNELKPEEIFERCAKDVITWEQRACSSPQVIFVEETILEEFLDGFPRYMELMSSEFPQENISFDEKVEILKAREMAKMQEAEGTGALYQSPRSMSWTVIREDSPQLKFSPLNRTIYVKPYKSWGDIFTEAVKMKPYLQTVGLSASPSQMKMFSKALARMGVSRIVALGKMAEGKSGAPHDFEFPLRRLIKWVGIEWIDKRFDLGEHIAPAKPALSRWDRLHNLLRFAKNHSAFYGKHLAGIDAVKSYDDFAKAPFLTKNHIYQNTPPVSSDLLTETLSNAYVFASGGSTGEPKFNYYSFGELDKVSTILADIYQIAGITKNDVIANLFMAGFLWTSFIVVNHALEKIGCVSLPISGNAELDLILRYIELFKPNVIIGLPSMIIRLAEEIKRRNLNIEIEKILYGGEHFSSESIKFLKETVNARMIRSAGYASVDAGPIGYQCDRCTGGVHHLLYEYVFFETIDPASDRSVEIGEAGEIVITNLNRLLMPIVRYRTGDLGRVLPNICTCLHRTPLFELLGRCDDILRVGAMSVYPSMISEALAKVDGLSGIFQLKAHYEDVKEVLTVRVESLEPLEDPSILAKTTQRTLLAHDEELELVIKEGWLKELRVEILSPGSIERNPRTGKIKQVIDERVIKPQH